MQVPGDAPVSFAGFFEPISSITHFLGAIVFAVLGARLVRRGGADRGRAASLAVYAVATVGVLSISGIYHLLEPGPWREVVRLLDVSSVFVLIAATATPLYAILFRGRSRALPLLGIWSFAIAGIVLRIAFAGELPRGVGATGFVLLGWAGAGAAVVLCRRYGYCFIRPLLLGGLIYTLGVLLLGLDRRWLPGLVGPHELWHLAVLAALALHWRFIFGFASGPPPERTPLGTGTGPALDAGGSQAVRPTSEG